MEHNYVAHYYANADNWTGKNAVVYYRESTEHQGRSWLGIEAQQYDVQRFSQRYKINIDKEFTEIISTRRKRRPQLEAALKYAKDNGSVLIIAMLDRLARSVAFISALMESKVQFIMADRPYATPFELHINAAQAEDERRRTSERTRNCLAAAKRRGTKLGKHGAEVLSVQNARAAANHAQHLRPLIEQLKKEGITTVRGITAELQRRKIPTFRRYGQWHVTSVQRMLKRLYHTTSGQ